MRKIVVVGGGITASSAAAALKRRIPSLDVQLVCTPAAPDALADQIISTLPSICGFHEDIGLTEADTVAGAASARRLGSLLRGWANQQGDFVHAYGPCGVPLGGVAFHQLWLREAQGRTLASFDRFSPSAELARRGVEADAKLEPTGYGLQLTLDRYGEMLRAYALHLGVGVQRSEIKDVRLRTADGFIEEIILTGGEAVGADLFVDATGPASLLHGRMGSRSIDWSPWLPCDRVALTQADPDAKATLLDSITALASGWTWKASSPQKGSTGIVYSSAHAGDSTAFEAFSGGREIVLHQGRKCDFWVRNCVAIGDSAVSVEPLEWTNLHLVHSQVDRLIGMMPGPDCAEVELAQFNRECAAEADRVRDFLCMHYICSTRPEPFWRDAAAIDPPASLNHTLSLFKERGRLPYYQEETFSRDSWLTVLLGQGVRPRRIDPLADLVPSDEAAQAFSRMRRSLERCTLPPGSPLLELNPHGIR